ncbi:hypothetical protein GCM10022419_037310 [Nonomuraea rosea]|uniref:histidine kinase n=1 Tax=Nonomuraea rosea TaxID=638574 RepID=A0ABP6WPH8_9ACTN
MHEDRHGHPHGDTSPRGRLRRSRATLTRLTRLGDVPVVLMLAWAGWLAVPWSFNGLAQARAAAAAAAADAEPPQVAVAAESASLLAPPASRSAESTAFLAPPAGRSAESTGFPAPAARLPAESADPGARWAPPAAWGIPAGRPARLTTVRPAHPDTAHHPTPTLDPAPASRDLGATDADAPRVDPVTADAVAPRWEPIAADAVASRPGPVAVDVVAVERARIAGEVHDAAGHGLAAIAMQAGIALVTFDDDPEQTRASLRAIRETSTTALAHLRAALDGIDPPGGDLPSLIDGVRAAGLPVDVEPPALVVPAHLQGAVYRVVRESLTNVLRHAGPTRALVRVGGDPRAFVLEIADRGAGWTGAGEGRGLTGMRARVTEAGGHLTAGPREGGGFRVVATFPQAPA